MAMATDRVKQDDKPNKINNATRFKYALAYSITGIASSICFVAIAVYGFHYDPSNKEHFKIIETMFFLKLAISGHMLIYVAHTKE
jgi:hypothetical protein